VAFGAPSGPPASTKQVAYLLSLVRKAGHDGFRDARHPLELTQRQAGGKFTIGEASTLIELLLAGDHTEGDAPPADVRTDVSSEAATRRQHQRWAELLAGMPADLLADELARRGWTATPPEHA